MIQFRFTLYIAGMNPRSEAAIESLRSLCETRMRDVYELEIVDVIQNPAAGEAERILTTPTLVKEFPAPPRRIMGDLTNAERVLLGLALQVAEELREQGG